MHILHHITPLGNNRLFMDIIRSRCKSSRSICIKYTSADQYFLALNILFAEQKVHSLISRCF